MGNQLMRVTSRRWLKEVGQPHAQLQMQHMRSFKGRGACAQEVAELGDQLVLVTGYSHTDPAGILRGYGFRRADAPAPTHSTRALPALVLPCKQGHAASDAPQQRVHELCRAVRP